LRESGAKKDSHEFSIYYDLQKLMVMRRWKVTIAAMIFTNPAWAIASLRI
jgi:hypothetical protein